MTTTDDAKAPAPAAPAKKSATNEAPLGSLNNPAPLPVPHNRATLDEIAASVTAEQSK